jgi:hypothetical protein
MKSVKIRCPLCNSPCSLSEPDCTNNVLITCWGDESDEHRADIIAWFKDQGLWNETLDHPDTVQARIKLKPKPTKWKEIKARSRREAPALGEYWKEARGIKTMFSDLRLLSAPDAAELGFARAPHMVVLIRRAETGKICGVQTTQLANPPRSGRAKHEYAKLTHGDLSGNYVELGSNNPSQSLVIGEGVESVGSVCHLTKLPGRVSLGASNLRNQQVPRTTAIVIIAIDRGETGEREAKVLAGKLHSQGLAVRMAMPPPGFDDWNDALTRAKHSYDELRKLIMRAPLYTPHAEISTKLICLGDVEQQETVWSWRGMWPRGILSTVYGPSGAGKSTAMIDIAARYTRGAVLPGNSAPCRRGSVIFLAKEDDLRSTIKHRLRLARADQSKIFTIAMEAYDPVSIASTLAYPISRSTSSSLATLSSWCSTLTIPSPASSIPIRSRTCGPFWRSWQSSPPGMTRSSPACSIPTSARI